MFLAHFSHTPIPQILDMDLDVVEKWYIEAVELHNYMNTPPEENT